MDQRIQLRPPFGIPSPRIPFDRSATQNREIAQQTKLRQWNRIFEIRSAEEAILDRVSPLRLRIARMGGTFEDL